MDCLEVLGYFSITLILFSFIFVKNFIAFHSINAFAFVSLLFFSFFTKSLPFICLSTGMAIISILKLYKHCHGKILFELLEIDPQDYVCKTYSEKNREKFNKYFGDNAISHASNAAFIFRNNEIAGLIAFTIPEPGTAILLIDYVAPAYRDRASGRHFYIRDLSFWHSKGLERLEVHNPSDRYIHYLEKMGFVQGHNPTIWEKSI